MEQVLNIWRALWAHRWKLLLAPLVAMAATWLFTRGTPSRYKTEARLYLNIQESKGLSLTDEDMKQYQVHTQFQNTIELLKSKKTVEHVQMKMVELSLLNEPPFADSAFWAKNKVATMARVQELLDENGAFDPRRPEDSLMASWLRGRHYDAGLLRESLLTYRILDSHFMKLEFVFFGAEEAQAIAGLFVESLGDQSRSLSRSKIRRHREVIESLVQQAKVDLDTKIKRLERYKVDNHIINLGEHTKAIVVYLVQLEGQRASLLSKIAAGNRGKSEVLDAVRNGNEVTLDLASHEEIIALKKQLQEMNHALLVASLQEEHKADLERIQANIDHTREAIQLKLQELARKTPFDPSRLQLDLAGKYVSYELDVETATHMVPVFDSEINRVSQYARRFAPHESTIVAYEQEISTAQNVYLTLLNKLNLTDAIEMGSAESIMEVIDPPYLPEGPEASKRPLMVAASGMGILVFLMGIIALLTVLDATIKTVAQFEDRLPLKVLAAFPSTSAEKIRKAGSLVRERLEAITRQQLMKIAGLVTRNVPSGDGMLVISSTGEEEGTIQVASSVKQEMELAGKKVRWIHADWLTESIPNGAENVIGLLTGGKFEQSMATLEKQLAQRQPDEWLIVTIASPAISGDASFWLGHASHVLHVFRAGRVMTPADQRVIDFYQNHPIQLMGAVMVDVPVESMEHYLGVWPHKENKWKASVRNFLNQWFSKIKTNPV